MGEVPGLPESYVRHQEGVCLHILCKMDGALGDASFREDLLCGVTAQSNGGLPGWGKRDILESEVAEPRNGASCGQDSLTGIWAGRNSNGVPRTDA